MPTCWILYCFWSLCCLEFIFTDEGEAEFNKNESSGCENKECTTCQPSWYGAFCRFTCDCDASLCDSIKGCLTDITIPPMINTSTLVTSKVTVSLSSNPAPNKTTSSSSNAMSNPASEKTTSSSNVMSIPATEKTASFYNTNNLVITITGSVLCVFLGVIIINQLHGKCQQRKQQSHILDNQQQRDANNMDEYQTITDGLFTSHLNNYNHLQQAAKDVNDDIVNVITSNLNVYTKPAYSEIQDSQHRPELPVRPLKQLDFSSSKDLAEEGKSCNSKVVPYHTTERNKADQHYMEIDENRTSIGIPHLNHVSHYQGNKTNANINVSTKISSQEQAKYDYPDVTDMKKMYTDISLISADDRTSNTYIQVIESTSFENLPPESLVERTDGNPLVHVFDWEHLRARDRESFNHDPLQHSQSLSVQYDDVIGIKDCVSSGDNSRYGSQNSTYLDVIG